MKQTYMLASENGPVYLITDPCSHYQENDARDLIRACGLLPGWAVDRQEGETMAQAIERQYVFYTGQMTGGEVTEEGAYQSPSDPPLYPYITLETQEGERMHIYPYAIVAILPQEGGDPWLSRCD